MTAERAIPPRGDEAARFTVLTLMFVLVLAVLLSLGVWQLRRKVWKEALLGRIAALQTAPAEPLSVVLNRAVPGVSRGSVTLENPIDYTRVQVLCDGLNGRSVHLYGVRASGPGWRQVAACTLPSGLPYQTLLVDLGFEATAQLAHPQAQRVTLPATGASVIGVLRTPDPPAWTDRLTGPANAGGSDQWFHRDIPGMTHALGAVAPAPFMLELETPAPGPGLIASPLPTDIPNSHLGYALTWFGLAAALVGVYAAMGWRLARRRG